MDDDGPYRPRYKGFDAEATRRAQETAARSRETAAPGGHVDAEYVDAGPDEAARRMKSTRAEVEAGVDRANARGRRRH